MDEEKIISTPIYFKKWIDSIENQRCNYTVKFKQAGLEQK